MEREQQREGLGPVAKNNEQWIELDLISGSGTAKVEKEEPCQLMEVEGVHEDEPDQKEKTKLTTISEVKLTQDRQRQMLYKQKKSKIPTMKVICSKCKAKDSVTATRSSFLCKQCGQRDKCTALYGVVICKSCEKKVLYMKATSSMVRCTNCSEINVVVVENKQEEEDEEPEEELSV